MFKSISICLTLVAAVVLSTDVAARVGIKKPAKTQNITMGGELIGKEAPAFSLDNVAGGSNGLAEHSGKFVLLDFWGTWCGPCVAGIPEMVEVYEQLDKDKFEFVSICVNCTNLESFVEEKGMNWTQLVGTDEVTDQYAISAFPTLLLINPAGKVVTDSFTEKGLRGNLRDTLAKLASENSK